MCREPLLLPAVLEAVAKDSHDQKAACRKVDDISAADSSITMCVQA